MVFLSLGVNVNVRKILFEFFDVPFREQLYWLLHRWKSRIIINNLSNTTAKYLIIFILIDLVYIQ